MRWNQIAAHELNRRTKNNITLRDLNRLKKLRKIRARDMEKKNKIVRLMYGEGETQSTPARAELEQDRLEFELEKIRAELALEIEKAEIDRDRKSKIQKKATRAIKRADGII